MTATNPWTAPPDRPGTWPPPFFRKRFALALLACMLALGLAALEKVATWQGTETAIATVVPLRKPDGSEIRRGEDLPSWVPLPLVTLRFETRDGQVVEARNYHTRQWASEGSRIPIRYDPRAPARGVVQGSDWDLVMQALLIAVLAWILLPPLWQAMWGGRLRFWPLWPWR